MSSELRLNACPNPKCSKTILKPILLSRMLHSLPEKYYACPHCFTRLNTIIAKTELKKPKENVESLNRILEKKRKGYPKCGGYIGYLRYLPESSPIPQECLNCPKILDCAMKIFDF